MTAYTGYARLCGSIFFMITMPAIAAIHMIPIAISSPLTSSNCYAKQLLVLYLLAPLRFR